jgi:hypothetical protein
MAAHDGRSKKLPAGAGCLIELSITAFDGRTHHSLPFAPDPWRGHISAASGPSS